MNPFLERGRGEERRGWGRDSAWCVLLFFCAGEVLDFFWFEPLLTMNPFLERGSGEERRGRRREERGGGGSRREEE